MQTFLPLPDYELSAICLDRQRLNKQRSEGVQIINILQGFDNNYSNHPAVKMWRGHLLALVEYTICICKEWRRRSYQDIYLPQLESLKDDLLKDGEKLINPPWFGEEALHASHRSNLLRKDPIWYGQFGWKESNDLPYWWPVL